MADQIDYGITRIAVGGHPFIEISHDEYLSILKAAQRLIVGNEIEDVFDVLIANYVEFEKEVLSIAVEESILLQAPEQLFDHKLTLGRRLTNVMTAARAYRDQMPSLMKGLDAAYGKAEFEKLLSEQYDARFGYRLMEALRDHAQHVAQPVERMTVCRRRTKEEGFESRIEISISRDELLADKGLKASFRREIAQDDAKGYRLLPALRGYVAGIGAAHEKLRSEGLRCIDDARASVEQAWETFRNAEGSKGKLTGVGVVERRANGTFAASQELSTNLVSRLRKLQSKNAMFVNLDRRYVTGMTDPNVRET